MWDAASTGERGAPDREPHRPAPEGLGGVAAETLGAIQKRGTYRRMRTLQGPQAPRMEVEGKEVLLFAGSNYLDLAHHPAVVEAAARAARELGCAAAGSRLINGNLAIHEALERELAEFLGTESVLTFSSGYMANLGVIPTLVGAGDAVVSDALNHASIVDGCRLSRAEVRVFPHADADGLAAVLGDVASFARRILVVVDGVYSMDGDLAPLAEIVRCAKRYGAMVMLDDAHGFGTLGARGRGTAEHLGVERGVDVFVGTLGKALGSFGAFVAGPTVLRELLVNAARSFIFTCALPPPQVAAARAALALIQAEPWRREQLASNAARLRTRLADRGVSTAPSTTHIVPVVVGESQVAMELCERLLGRGFYAQGIRHPSVAEGTARLRITPMATHTSVEIDALASAVAAELARLPGNA
ncbi:MAG TPA: 8-amino-7-oxononanoate synthase [Myxococcota bacterium]|nr:8-amino-7-oxononanoate synthase [Myxococcota bacterium]